MSVEVMSMVFKHYPEGGSEMLLALALADFSNDTGTQIYPSVAALAKKLASPFVASNINFRK